MGCKHRYKCRALPVGFNPFETNYCGNVESIASHLSLFIEVSPSFCSEKRDSPLPLNGDFQCKNNESLGSCNIYLALLCFVTSVDVITLFALQLLHLYVLLLCLQRQQGVSCDWV